jgi:hypothetical protein
MKKILNKILATIDFSKSKKMMVVSFLISLWRTAAEGLKYGAAVAIYASLFIVVFCFTKYNMNMVMLTSGLFGVVVSKLLMLAFFK